MSNTVFCIGELLIDFICTDIDVNLTNGVHFERKAGGAPANVCAAITNLGGRASFAGKVGDDPFGRYLIGVLTDNGVDVSNIRLDKKNSTTLAFVSLAADGNRDFHFNRGADELLQIDEIKDEDLLGSKIIHFGSATALLGGMLYNTYLKSLEKAKGNGNFISFDPNYRSDLWRGRIDDFIAESNIFIKQADFVKVSEEELFLIANKKDIESGVTMLHELGAKFIAVTLGEKGTFISNGTQQAVIPSIKVNSIDSTGAGDAFVGACLYKLSLQNDPRSVLSNFEEMIDITAFANKAGAIVCTSLGAIASLAGLSRIED